MLTQSFSNLTRGVLAVALSVAANAAVADVITTDGDPFGGGAILLS